MAIKLRHPGTDTARAAVSPARHVPPREHTTVPTSRWFAVGESADPDPRRAGADAAEAALTRADAKLLVVFCSDAYDLTELLAAINERSGGTPLIGCSTAGEIAPGGPSDQSVVVTALGGEGFTVRTASAPNASGRPRHAGAQVGATVAHVSERPHRVLLLLADGLVADPQEIVRGAHSVAGAEVPLVGGGASDGMKMRATYQLHNDRVLTDAVVGAALGSEAPMGIGVSHGWCRVGEPMRVTRSVNNRVYTLDDLPALEVYLDRLRPPEEVHHDPSAFTRFALRHPIALGRRSGEDQVRVVGGADFSGGSLGLMANMPEGGKVWLMEGTEDSVLRATDAACAEALAPLGDRPVLGVIAFDCATRREVLGPLGVYSEIARVSDHVSGAPVSGFYAYGEFARTHGVNGVHNETLVLLALS